MLLVGLSLCIHEQAPVKGDQGIFKAAQLERQMLELG